MNLTKIALVSLLVVGLVLGLTIPALADNDSTSSQTENVSFKLLAGEVISINQGAKTFVLQSQDEQLTVVTNSDTEYFKTSSPARIMDASEFRAENGRGQIKPKSRRGLTGYQEKLRHRNEEGLGLDKWFSRFTDGATIGDVMVGARVVIRAVPEGDNLLAKQVLIVEQRLVPNQVTGTVAGISLANKTITVTPAEGSQNITLNYNEETRFILSGVPVLEVGQTVRVIYNGDLTIKVVSMTILPVAETTEAAQSV